MFAEVKQERFEEMEDKKMYQFLGPDKSKYLVKAFKKEFAIRLQ
jgi:hypothetical protein